MSRLVLAFFLFQAFLICYLNAEDAEMHSEDPEYVKSIFKSFQKTHGKKYQSGQHENEKFKVFKEALKKITEHNKAYKNGTFTYHLGINKFADMSPQEFGTWVKSGVRLDPVTFNQSVKQVRFARQSVPQSVDYRIQMLPIKNQDQCGSCWAFSAVAALEHQYFKAKGTKVPLSEQQLVDCVYMDSKVDPGHDGCKGGNMGTAYDTLKQRALASSKDYPYSPVNRKAQTAHSQKCQSKPGYIKVTSWSQTPQGNEAEMKKALATKGVLAIIADVNPVQYYKGGIFNGAGCSSHPIQAPLQHAMALVGYGPGYYLIRNSWDTTWGEQGFLRIASGSNVCGIANWVYLPSIQVIR